MGTGLVLESPIFVRGISRAGGTLLVTLLDAHPRVAMSYELYSKLLSSDGATARFRKAVLGATTLRGAVSAAGNPWLAAFIGRADRGGLALRDLQEFARDMPLDAFSAAEGRIRFVGICCGRKAAQKGADRWGAKCLNNFSAYRAVWPQAKFLHIVRDGRDVLASQCGRGAFDSRPATVAREWAGTFRAFRAFAETCPGQAREVRYEALVRDPAPELQGICTFLDIPFDAKMLEHERQNLTIFRARSHLSMAALRQPINDKSVGRWRRDLADDQVGSFMALAGDAMREAGYAD